jgi:hypothetical protein
MSDNKYSTWHWPPECEYPRGYQQDWSLFDETCAQIISAGLVIILNIEIW